VAEMRIFHSQKKCAGPGVRSAVPSALNIDARYILMAQTALEE
jgi:hypothetical protein